MKIVLYSLIAVFVVFVFFFMPETVSAQMFRRFGEDRSNEMVNGAKSRLPNPAGAISPGNYGPAPQVSEVVLAEVRGTIPVRSVPDFGANPNQKIDLNDVPQLFTILRPNWSANGTPVLPPKRPQLKFPEFESSQALTDQVSTNAAHISETGDIVKTEDIVEIGDNIMLIIDEIDETEQEFPPLFLAPLETTQSDEDPIPAP